jgi:A/G-specific adenine glycosylase
MSISREPAPAGLPSTAALEAFRAEVWAHFRANRREMPWRESADPYAVLVSEVMLQQTQVARVTPRYRDWLEAFPTLESLAAAPLPAVLERWQGLGYNRRALALKRAAELAVERFGGALPADEATLRTLPGIGPVTAAALMDYAFGVPTPFIETNVRAVFLHHFFADADGVPDSALIPIVAATWDADDPRGWGYALMDYGVHLKREFPNPSRRSSHHARQSTFEGSRRQKRARLLRAVLADPGSGAEAYAAGLGIEPTEAEELLEALAAEGFLVCDGDRWSVREG